MRNDGVLGRYIYSYEGGRYHLSDYKEHHKIVVPTDAETFADVSFYQAGMDWDVYATHHRAAFLRISQNTWKDTALDYHYTHGRRVGVAMGGYVFYDGRQSPQAQAATVIGAMQGKYLDMELIVDWERSYQGQHEGLANVVALMQLLEGSGIPCKAVGMYTGYYWFINNSSPTVHAGQYAYLKTRPLWLAWYASPDVVKAPPPWETWTHWQYGTPTTDWGQPTAEIDANKHNGTRAQFEERYLGGAVPPPTGGMMYKLKVNVTALNGRGTPDGVTKYQGGFKRDDILSADANETHGGVVWHRIQAQERAGVSIKMPQIPLWASTGPTTDPAYPYLLLQETPPPTPAPTKPMLEIVYSPADVDVILKPQ